MFFTTKNIEELLILEISDKSMCEFVTSNGSSDDLDYYYINVVEKTRPFTERIKYKIHTKNIYRILI